MRYRSSAPICIPPCKTDSWSSPRESGIPRRRSFPRWFLHMNIPLVLITPWITFAPAWTNSTGVAGDHHLGRASAAERLSHPRDAPARSRARPIPPKPSERRRAIAQRGNGAEPRHHSRQVVAGTSPANPSPRPSDSGTSAANSELSGHGAAMNFTRHFQNQAPLGY